MRDAIQPVKEQLSLQEIERKRELRKYLGGAYHRLDLQLKREGRRPWHLSESEVYAFKLRDDALTAEMLSIYLITGKPVFRTSGHVVSLANIAPRLRKRGTPGSWRWPRSLQSSTQRFGRI